MPKQLKSGNIVRLSWPYTDLTRSKNRPALVLSDEDERGDVELVMITTHLDDAFAFPILPAHYVSDAHLPESSAVPRLPSPLSPNS